MDKHLIEFRMRQQKNFFKAKRVIDALPDFPWRIEISSNGNVRLFTTEFAAARKALIDSGGREFTTTDDTFFIGNEIVFVYNTE